MNNVYLKYKKLVFLMVNTNINSYLISVPTDEHK